VHQTEPAADCIPLCGAQAITLMGSHAVGKYEMLHVLLLRDKADLALLCFLGDVIVLIAKEKPKANSTKYGVQNVSCSTL